MKVWTVHARAANWPVLVPERFTWAGLIFGPLWLLMHRCWIPGVIALAIDTALAATRLETIGTILIGFVSWMVAVFGQDLRRWSLARRGFALVDVVAERSADGALHRTLDRRPALVGEALR